MPLPIAQTVLVAGRGETACRVLRSAGGHGLRTVAVHAEDAPDDPHLELADHVTALPGTGPAAHLDQRAVLDAAVAYGARLLHPADARLAEDPDFAAACAARGVVLAGPGEPALRRLGDKVLARDAARAAGVRTLPGTAAPTSADQVRRFLGRHPDGIVLKPARGWGGHGVVAVHHESDVDDAFATATAAALATTGDPALYAERLAEWARQIEVQVVGAPHEGGVRVLALGDRDASVQRGRRPLVDVAPAPQLRDGVRRALHAAAARFAASIGLCGVATVELLLADDEFVFLEANPRLVLGDAVTEAVTGVDLVVTQLEIARHAVFGELELPDGVVVDGGAAGVVDGDAGATSGVPHRPAGIAIEAHVMSERVRPDGSAVPTLGTVGRLEPPTGAGVRVDSRCLVTDGVVVGEDDDTLLATVVTAVRGDDLPGTAARCAQVLDDLVLDGPPTTVPLLLALLRDRELGERTVGLDYLDRRLPDLLAAAAAHEPRPVPPGPSVPRATARTHRADLADRSGAADGDDSRPGAADEVERVLGADRPGLAIEVAPPGTRVGAGEPVALVADQDGHQHLLCAPVALVVGRPLTGRGAPLDAGDPVLAYVEAAPAVQDGSAAARERDDLEEVRRRHAGVLDAARGRHVASRRAAGRRTVRELVAALVEDGSFVEFGPLVVGEPASPSEEGGAPQRPVVADGLVCGVATVNGALVDAADARVVVLAHDPTATPDDSSGERAHAKAERVLALAAQHRLPVVLLPEGGGPHDLAAGTLAALARLRGRVPVVGIATGSSFGARAALLGLCDVVVATPDAVLGLGDPALVEAAGLGRFEEPDVGPVRTHRRTGVVHLLAADDAEAVVAARDVLGRFQGSLTVSGEGPGEGSGDVLRGLVPADRLAPFEVRAVVTALADAGSVLELAPEHAPGLLTALVRVDGRTLGVVANSGEHLDGALDAEAIGKLGGFWRTCDAHRLPVLALVDTPGLVVGPDAERDGGLRALGRLLSEGARLSVPYGVVVLRRAYGLAASAMAGGPANATTFTVAWPTAELGAVRLDHAVRLEHGHELDAEPDAEAREALLGKLVAEAHARGAALAAAAAFDVDDVVDPAETRRWVRMLLRPRTS